MTPKVGPTGLGAQLEWLSDVEVGAKFHFTDRDSLARSLRSFFYNAYDRDSLSDHTALVTDFPLESFIMDEDEDDYDAVDDRSFILRHHKPLYLTDSKILLLTMVSKPHEVASRRFGSLLTLKLDKMNCFYKITPTGGATREMENWMGNVRKSPDESWGPSGSGYPTFVVESAVSESCWSLCRDAKIWLEHVDSHITQVVTIKIHRTRPEIVFTVWKGASQDRDAPSQHPPRAVVDQEIHVKLEDKRPMAERHISLSFEKIFERRPRPGTAEGDFIFSKRELGILASEVWIGMRHTVQE